MHINYQTETKKNIYWLLGHECLERLSHYRVVLKKKTLIIRDNLCNAGHSDLKKPFSPLSMFFGFKNVEILK